MFVEYISKSNVFYFVAFRIDVATLAATPVSINSCALARQRKSKRNAKARKKNTQRQNVGAQNISVAFVVLICVCGPNVFGLY